MRLMDWLGELSYEHVQGSLDREVKDVIYDSRKACPDTVFVCMRGASVDSHKFAGDVIAKGTKVLVVEREVEAPEDVTVLKVENGRSALAYLSAARFGYPLRKMTAIGVTGTNGKTTVATLLYNTFRYFGYKVGLVSTVCNYIDDQPVPTEHTTPDPTT